MQLTQLRLEPKMRSRASRGAKSSLEEIKQNIEARDRLDHRATELKRGTRMAQNALLVVYAAAVLYVAYLVMKGRPDSAENQKEFIQDLLAKET